jgi:hypothetical protein
LNKEFHIQRHFKSMGNKSPTSASGDPNRRKNAA